MRSDCKKLYLYGWIAFAIQLPLIRKTASKKERHTF